MDGKPKTQDEWYDALHNEIGDAASDRAVAIVAAAMLDHALKDLPEKRLIKAPKDQGLLAGPEAPIGSFSVRISAAYQLGLIALRFARDLHHLRNIRNDAAHRNSATKRRPPFYSKSADFWGKDWIDLTSFEKMSLE